MAAYDKSSHTFICFYVVISKKHNTIWTFLSVFAIIALLSLLCTFWYFSTIQIMENSMDTNLLKVGKYNNSLNSVLGINLSEFDIYRSKGLPAHMLKSRHEKCLKYIDYIPDIINHPDYIGINPNETRTDSIELIKRYKDNILIGIKLDKSRNYLYISTMYDIQESKIQRRLHSGRLKEFPY